MTPYDLADLEQVVAMKILVKMTMLATSRKPTHRAMALAWVDSTGDTEGSIQWVAAGLQRRPAVLARAILSLVTATSHKRAAVRKRLERIK